MPRCLVWVATVLLATSLAAAEDRPIAAVKLVLKRSGSGSEKLVFVSRDPAFLFPTIGGVDDPATGSPGGALLELFSQHEGRAAFAIPPGVGEPGWTVKAAKRSYRFVNRSAPAGPSTVRIAKIDGGRRLEVSGASVGLALAGPQGLVGVRVTTGSLRNCALFDVTTVQHDEANVFRASHAEASALPDCSDGSLSPTPCESAGAPTCGGYCPAGSVCATRDQHSCVCIAATDPCGTTGPVCNGECPAGEECMPIGGWPLLNCGCLPAGSVPCGQSTCGGLCPPGLECNEFVSQFPQLAGCRCGPPGPCGGDSDDCPAGFVCAVGEFTMCVPVFCGSTYPICDGGCDDGRVCQALRVDTAGGLEWCLCAADAPCDTTCGGLACPEGEVCVMSSEGCGCEVLTECCQGSVPSSGVNVCADVPSATAASRCDGLGVTLATVGGSASLAPAGTVCDGSGTCATLRTTVGDCCQGDATCAEGSGSAFDDGCAALGGVLHPGNVCTPTGLCAP